MLVIKRVVLHRREDPQHEHRELLIYRDTGPRFYLYQAIGFIDSEYGFSRREKLGLGSEGEMRKLLGETVERLCGEEGFTKVEQRFDSVED
jgi:hypothetical protein